MTDLVAQLAATHAAAFTFPRPWSAGEIGALLDQKGVFLTGDSRSFALGRTILDETELLTIATHPDHRRMGLARQVLDQFVQTAQNAGSTVIFLEVAAGNAAAIRLYHAMGFARTGQRPAYYRHADGTKEAALLMAHALRSKTR